MSELHTPKVLLCTLGLYTCSVLTNNIIKDVQHIRNLPFTYTFVQFFQQIIYAGLLLSFISKKKIDPSFLQVDYWRANNLLVLGVIKLSTGLLNQLALSYASVSFVQTVKVTTPIFTIFFCRVILNDIVPPSLIFAVVLIVCGVALTITGAVEWDFYGLLFSIAGSIALSLNSIYTKISVSVQNLEPLSLIFHVNIVSCILGIPVILFFENFSLLDVLHDFTSVSLLLKLGFYHIAQSLFAIYLISHVVPVTYSIISITKRAVLIIFFTIWTNIEGGNLNFQAAGLFVAFAGLIWYAKVKNDAGSHKPQTQDNFIEMGKVYIV